MRAGEAPRQRPRVDIGGFHSFRRVWVRDLKRAGIPLDEIRRMGGWATMEALEQYLFLDAPVQRKAIEALDRAMGG